MATDVCVGRWMGRGGVEWEGGKGMDKRVHVPIMGSVAASEPSCRCKRVDDHSRFYAKFKDFLPTRLRIRTFLLIQLSLGLLLVLVQLRQLLF